jgi:hypothetical protein
MMFVLGGGILQDKISLKSVEDFMKDDSFYSEEERVELAEDDELEPWEVAWMKGYDEAE